MHYTRWERHGSTLIVKDGRFKPGQKRGHRFPTKHGLTHSPTYETWHAMIQRCTNPRASNWGYYGGRGITVCDRWLHSFENFLADMGMRPADLSLDRIDNDGNYEPGNCRWATAVEQSQNRRGYGLLRQHPGAKLQ